MESPLSIKTPEAYLQELIASDSPSDYTFNHLLQSYELLKAVRTRYIEIKKKNFINKRTSFGTATSEADVQQYYKILLEEEFGILVHFLNHMVGYNGVVDSDCASEFMEVNKFLSDIKAELAQIDEQQNGILLANYSISEAKTEVTPSLITNLGTSSEIILQKLGQLAGEKNKFLERMPLKVVIEHFSVFIERKNTHGGPYLTPKQFICFIEKAFLGKKEIPVQKINCGYGDKGYIIKRFYEFLQLAIKKYWEINEKDKYIKLVADNFDNWGYKTVKTSFKADITKRNW